jgi:hypothetical protein
MELPLDAREWNFCSASVTSSAVARPSHMRLVLVQQMQHLQGIHMYGEEALHSRLLGPRGQPWAQAWEAAASRSEIRVSLSMRPHPFFYRRPQIGFLTEAH